MLDENLPTFTLHPSLSGTKHHNEFYLTHYGSQPEPAYHLEHADPASPSPLQKNCYAAALFDSYNPEVLFGEVLARPEWTKSEGQSSGSGGGGGIPPAPQPALPGEFVVQLYNPDQQVRVEVKSSKWGGSDSYEFSLPQDSFRTPSLSSLDKSASDPASLEVTPRINFVWRKDGRLNKDLTCFMTGKNTDAKKKKKREGKDPDISIALWKRGEELTMYEPNLGRIEMEDPKGLEVVLLLSAVVIKDLYFSPKDQLREVFNISDTPTSPRKLSAGGRKVSNPKNTYGAATLAPAPPGAGDPKANKRHSLPPLQTAPQNQQALYNTTASNAAPPFADPRAQWESEAETARLKAQVEAEKAAAQRKRREQDKKDEAERKRLQKMVEEEEKAARKNQAAVDKETERLRKLYGVKPIPQYQSNQARPSVPPRPMPGPSGYSYPGGGGVGAPPSGYSARQVHARPYLAAPRPTVGSNGLLTGGSVSAQNLTMSGGAGPRPVSSNGLPIPGSGQGQGQNVRKKSSFWR